MNTIPKGLPGKAPGIYLEAILPMLFFKYTKTPYWVMVDEWRGIVDGPGSDEQKCHACMSVLCTYLCRLAHNRVRQENAPLRFYADMVVLRYDLTPHSTHDQLGRLAIHPASAAVRDWLAENAHLTATRNLSRGIVDLDRMVGTIYAPVPHHRLITDVELPPRRTLFEMTDETVQTARPHLEHFRFT